VGDSTTNPDSDYAGQLTRALFIAAGGLKYDLPARHANQTIG
jgi:hypothetical protein